MSLTKKARNILLGAGMAAALLVGLGSAANAVEPVAAPVPEPLEVESDGIIQVPVEYTPSQLDFAIQEALEDLAGVQSQEEIAALAEMPFTTFLAGDSGEYIAAVNTGPLVSTRAVQWTSPGCTTHGLCIRNSSGTPFGFIGSGELRYTINNAVNAESGDRYASVTTNWGNIYVLRSWQGVRFPAQTITYITRG